MDFSLAYEYAEIAHRAIKDPWSMGIEGREEEFLINDLNEFHEILSKPRKKTLLHKFIYNLRIDEMEQESGWLDWSEIVERYAAPMISAGIEVPSWFNENDIEFSDYQELYDLRARVVEVASDAAFYLLFNDRVFLYDFQKYVQPVVKKLKVSETPILKKDGVLKRPTHIPEWLRGAIFHRDKGRCQMCYRDITGLVTPGNDRHMDHMIPLEESGINDPTNFQLLCSSCNTSKGKKMVFEDPLYHKYW